MKKLILLAAVCLALGTQKSNAQVNFNLSISSGPAYGYYEPAYYAAPVVYTRPVVYHRPVAYRRPVVYHAPRRYYSAPRTVYHVKQRGYGKHYFAPGRKSHHKAKFYGAAPRGHHKVQYNAVRGHYQKVHHRR